MIVDARRCHSREGENKGGMRQEDEAWTLRLSEKKKRRRWWGEGKREGKREIKRRRLEGGQKWPSFPFCESNQILLIAHYLKRLSGTVMRLHAGPRLRDFLVYQCWRVL